MIENDNHFKSIYFKIMVVYCKKERKKEKTIILYNSEQNVTLLHRTKTEPHPHSSSYDALESTRICFHWVI